MNRARSLLQRLLIASCAGFLTAGCAFQGLNSLALPGAEGRGPGASTFQVELENVATLEPNSPVLLDDVVVGSVGRMTVNGWHADVEVSVKPGVAIPANAVATVGQTSVLGSMHLALNPPLNEAPTGRLAPGSTISLARSMTYPTTEQTLSSLAAVVNGGGLGQIGDIIHNFNAAFSGREADVRDLIGRLDTLMKMLDGQRDNVVATIRAVDRLAATVAGRRDVVADALRQIPPALEVLDRERPRLTTALDKLRVFSDTSAGLINDAQADLVRNLNNLGPTLRALADVGPDLAMALGYATTFPLNQNFIDRAVRGDYVNLYTVFDLTIPRLKRTLFLGTRFGDQGAAPVPAPGDPWYLNYTYDPLGVGVSTPPPDSGPPPPGTAPAPALEEQPTAPSPPPSPGG